MKNKLLIGAAFTGLLATLIYTAPVFADDIDGTSASPAMPQQFADNSASTGMSGTGVMSGANGMSGTGAATDSTDGGTADTATGDDDY